ncbi:sugar transferase [Pseudonocardia petroleophila]|uniref:Sugar transferase n=1 Tax=Pseudonocardia petroleophila TaxID=37331 RepID=A0A7G7MQH0_9PSEU|nr:sugar transferase [Pseudonocardia petroleophila]QNG55031.1 sugar transferase [Pseudonocardia petroleophila]
MSARAASAPATPARAASAPATAAPAPAAPAAAAPPADAPPADAPPADAPPADLPPADLPTADVRPAVPATPAVPAAPAVPAVPATPAVRTTPLAPAAPARPGRPLDERVSGVAVLLVVTDLAAIAAALLLAGPGRGWALAVGGTLFAVRTGARLYRRRLWLSYYHDLPRCIAADAASFGLVAALAVVLGEHDSTIRTVGVTVLLFFVIGAVPRAGVLQVARWARRRFGRGERAIVLGTGTLGVDLVRSMLDQPEFGLLPVGFIDPSPPADSASLPVPLLSGSLHDAIVAERVGVIVLAYTNATDAQIVDAAITAHSQGATILMVPRMWELYSDSADIERLRGYPLVRVASAPTERPSWWVKRGLDSLLAAVALVLCSPLLAAAAIAVVVESGRPILFRQERVGLDGRTFPLLKLRSMRPADETESQTRWNIAGDPRIGPVGRVLRRTSIDELPQLWNILRGDMSLVGPRPERPGFVAEFSQVHDRYWARHRVPAGLTGLAQVNGLRGDTSIADRSRYDNYYIANWSLWLDLKILLLTVREVFRSGQH